MKVSPRPPSRAAVGTALHGRAAGDRCQRRWHWSVGSVVTVLVSYLIGNPAITLAVRAFRYRITRPMPDADVDSRDHAHPGQRHGRAYSFDMTHVFMGKPRLPAWTNQSRNQPGRRTSYRQPQLSGPIPGSHQPCPITNWYVHSCEFCRVNRGSKPCCEKRLGRDGDRFCRPC